MLTSVLEITLNGEQKSVTLFYIPKRGKFLTTNYSIYRWNTAEYIDYEILLSLLIENETNQRNKPKSTQIFCTEYSAFSRFRKQY